VNYAQALKEFGNEADVLADVLTGFVSDAKQQIKKVRNAVVYGDTDMIASEAHSMKGGSSNLTATFLADAAAALEAAAKSGSLTQTASRIDALEAEVQRMAQFVETL
jgi:HPt (histidine-containing phosphotransfer) domain-containing protein